MHSLIFIFDFLFFFSILPILIYQFWTRVLLRGKADDIVETGVGPFGYGLFSFGVSLVLFMVLLFISIESTTFIKKDSVELSKVQGTDAYLLSSQEITKSDSYPTYYYMMKDEATGVFTSDNVRQINSTMQYVTANYRVDYYAKVPKNKIIRLFLSPMRDGYDKYEFFIPEGGLKQTSVN